MPLAKIFYASLTGNTEEIADIVAESLEDLDFDVEIEECSNVSDYFCKSVDDFEQAFLKTGAIKGADSVKVELNAEDEDIDDLEEFAKQLAKSVEENA